MNEVVSYGLQILDGLDERTIPHFGDEMLNSPLDVLLDWAFIIRRSGERTKTR